MGWDPELKLLAVGTKNGQIRVFGKPGVEIIGQLDKEDVSLVGIVWIPGEWAESRTASRMNRTNVECLIIAYCSKYQ